MAALLKNAINPNLVQTMEGTPAFVHGGPFANIAHGCNSLIATQMALKLADFVVTEAGFGADLGAEKFFDIKCRAGKLNPAAVVLVVPKRATDVHGLDNLLKHVENVRSFNLPVVVSINKYAEDDAQELEQCAQRCLDAGVAAVTSDFREQGGEGGLQLAELIADVCADPTPRLEFLYPLDMRLADKVCTICRKIYGAADVRFTPTASQDLHRIENLGYGQLPVCMAKTPMSLTDNPKISGRPKDFTITISGEKVSAGAGFVVIYTGKTMTMPGLPQEPAALKIDIDDNGVISGLF